MPTPAINPLDELANRDARDAFLAARLAHADFDQLLPAMRFVASVCRPDWNLITLAEYVECLYVIVKHANFAAQARETLLKCSKPGEDMPASTARVN